MSTKFTNPKDGIGITKLPAHLVSPIVKAYQAIAHYLGNVKYGAWNYRAAGARASVYKAALERHIDAWWEGEECDPVDGTPHLANALACIGILIDAKHAGLLTDDRPPSQASELRSVRDQFEALMPRLLSMYGERKVRHYTIADTAGIAATRVVETTKGAWVGVDPGTPGGDRTSAVAMPGGVMPCNWLDGNIKASDLAPGHAQSGESVGIAAADESPRYTDHHGPRPEHPIAPLLAWGGGERPVDATAWVQYVMRGWPHVRHGGRADSLIWSHGGCESDIVAYRVVSEQ